MTATGSRAFPAPDGLHRAILEQAPDAVIFADRQGRVQLWNHGAEVLFGYTAREAIGQPLDIIIPEKLRQAHDEGFARALATGRLKAQGRVLTTRASGKYGARLYVDFSFALVKDAAGAVSGVVAIGRDVTAAWLEKAARRATTAAAGPA